METIASAKEKFGTLLETQRSRVAAMRAQGDFIDYALLPQARPFRMTCWPS